METKTVKELKQMCRERGLKLEHKGHKFNKGELIANLVEYEKKQEEKMENKVTEVVQEQATEVKEVKDKYKKSVMQLTKECIDKYTTQEEHCLNVETKEFHTGSFIAYIRCIETRAGKLIRKIGTAKVINCVVDDDGFLDSIKAETPVGETIDIPECDVLYIRGDDEYRYPKDIGEVLFKQRENYREFKERQRERYGEQNRNNN